MDPNRPECSHDSDSNQQSHEENNINEALPNAAPETLASSITPSEYKLNSLHESIPLLFQPSFQSAIMCQPRNNLELSTNSLIMPNQPHSLFLQALSKLNKNSLHITGLGQLTASTKVHQNLAAGYLSRDITPPDSLTSAPPSYSYVLNQIAARRRPRLVGTFVPSPSFVQPTPPPTYGTAFDIYVDNPMPPQPQRVYNFGFVSMPAICPECGFAGMTVITSKITLCTHLCAFLLCLFCCWICAPLPYILRSCKDVYHYCQNCRTFLGMYCPTNPDSNFTHRPACRV